MKLVHLVGFITKKLNCLKTKLSKLCIMVQFVPRCKHTASLLWKPFYAT